MKYCIGRWPLLAVLAALRPDSLRILTRNVVEEFERAFNSTICTLCKLPPLHSPAVSAHQILSSQPIFFNFNFSLTDPILKIYFRRKKKKNVSGCCEQMYRGGISCSVIAVSFSFLGNSNLLSFQFRWEEYLFLVNISHHQQMKLICLNH